MNWTQSETLALAKQACVHCFGLGLIQSYGAKFRPCHCVERAIFRACYARFERCVEGKQFSRSHYTDNYSSRNRRQQTYGFRDQEYMADFVLVSKRVLNDTSSSSQSRSRASLGVIGEGTLAYRVFKYHFLLGADHHLCCRKLKLPRGEFFHEVYRIQQKLGRAFREVEPHALFPLDEYFGGVNKKHGPIRPLAADVACKQPFGSERPAALLPLERCSLCVPLATAA